MHKLLDFAMLAAKNWLNYTKRKNEGQVKIGEVGGIGFIFRLPPR